MGPSKEGVLNILLALWLSLAAHAHQSVMTKIATLNEIEAYAPMVFHNHLLWLGRVDYSQRKSVHWIEIRTPDGETLLGKQLISHSVERLYPFDKDRILVMGKAYTSAGWVTYYSTVRSCCGAIAVETHAVPSTFQVEEFAGTPELLFFNETGERSVVAANAAGYGLLPIQVSGPGQMQLVGDALWILERRSVFFGDENIARVDLKTMKVERAFSDPRKGLSNLIALNDGSALATAEYHGEKLLLLNSQDYATQTEVPIRGTHPRAVAEWGRCLLVASEYPHRISVVSRATETPEVIFEFELDYYASDLPNIKKITVDPETGSVFLRSSVVPDLGQETFNSVYRFSSSLWIPACEVTN